MIALGNLLRALTDLLGWIFFLLEGAIFIRVLLSWANADPYNSLVKMLTAVTEPLLRPFRSLLPPWKMGGWDLSPLFAVLALELLKKFFIPTLYEVAARLG